MELMEAWMRHLSKDKLSKQQTLRISLKLRGRDQVMTWRTREPGDSILHFLEKNLLRELWVYEELIWK